MKQQHLLMRHRGQKVCPEMRQTKNPSSQNISHSMMSYNISFIGCCLIIRSTSSLNLKDKSCWSEKGSKVRSWWQLKSKSCSRSKRSRKRMAKSQTLCQMKLSSKRKLPMRGKQEGSISGKMTSLTNLLRKCKKANQKTKLIDELKNSFRTTTAKCTRSLARESQSWSSPHRGTTQPTCSSSLHSLVW